MYQKGYLWTLVDGTRFGIHRKRRGVTVALVGIFYYALVQAFGERFDWFVLTGSQALQCFSGRDDRHTLILF